MKHSPHATLARTPTLSHSHTAQMHPQRQAHQHAAQPHTLGYAQHSDKHVCAAQQWVRTVPHHTLMHQGCTVDSAMFRVTVQVIAVSTAAWQREEAMRNLFAMDSTTARSVLTRVEDSLVQLELLHS